MVTYISTAILRINGIHRVQSTQLLRLRAISIDLVDCFEISIEPMLGVGIDEFGIYPVGSWEIVDLEVRLGHDAEVHSGTLHAPVQVRVGRCRDLFDVAIGEHDSHVNDVVEDQAEVSHVSTEASAKGRAYHPSAATVGRSCEGTLGANLSKDEGAPGNV